MPDPVQAPSSGELPPRVSSSERDKGYRDLLSYIVSNAVAGEIMAVENYAQMVHLMPDVSSKIDA